MYFAGRADRGAGWKSLAAATALLAPALYGLVRSAGETTVEGAYAAFACAVIVWGWIELSFLTGVLTGPRRQACPAGCRGARHFVHGVQALLYHELALLAGVAVVLALSWRAPNPLGAWTFVALWVMRESTKLNLFLGVRNLGLDFLPERLRYLRGYFRRRAVNWLFPFSVTVPTVVAAWLAQEALAAHADPFRATSFTLLAALITLGVLEHWFLVLPLQATALWRWSLRPRCDTIRAGDAEIPPARGLT
jgi:putative photosynthetic complex assembly protein 2